MTISVFLEKSGRAEARSVARGTAAANQLARFEHDDLKMTRFDVFQPARVLQKFGDAFEDLPVGLRQAVVFQGIAQPQFKPFHRHRIVKGNERTSVGERNKNNPRQLVERTARIDRDDGASSKHRQLRGNTRPRREFLLHDLHDSAAQILVDGLEGSNDPLGKGQRDGS